MITRFYYILNLLISQPINSLTNLLISPWKWMETIIVSRFLDAQRLTIILLITIHTILRDKIHANATYTPQRKRFCDTMNPRLIYLGQARNQVNCKLF